jgi:hypothetical protein
MGLCYELTLSVMRNDNGHIYPVSINHSFNSWRKLSIWRG